ncbi:YrrS family protein [Sporolactobacillus shoreicorticis]|uniref:YrrS family protein n=1 Tax=Sporolactobacillus shoreicorticis TaxID=1923877 RepID=A0ABW5S5J9_9BACL|nr:YrrS family protein [Sporolactobacillus shoreicorticis]MCO7126375.1 YrrS family protein [Sporolactobacillus shoreicorticis]
MRSQRGNGYSSSRMEQRKSKTDRLLSWTIGIVSLLILAIGCIILISVFHTSPDSKPAASSSPSSSSAQSHESKEDQSSSSESSQASNDESGNSESSNSSSESSSSSSESLTEDENHQASYEMGSADWNAQVQAISEATGIDEANMTIRWLGNGGTPNSSLARVAPKSDQSAIYVVHLIYKGGRWQADNVKKP